MIRLSLILLSFASAVFSGEVNQPNTVNKTYPLWDGKESVAQYANRVGLPQTETLDLGNETKLELALVPPGSFMMGTPEPAPPDETIMSGQLILILATVPVIAGVILSVVQARRKQKRLQFSLMHLLLATMALGIGVYGGVRWHRATQLWEKYGAEKAYFDFESFSERPIHLVLITKPFYMGKFEVTQLQYRAVMNADPSISKADNHPANSMTWDQAQQFCEKVGQRCGRQLSLPTEAEWEYAARAGTTTKGYLGDSDADLERAAWYPTNSGGKAMPVGLRVPNQFGLYDMLGNAWEWCADWYSTDYYEMSPQADPQGPENPTAMHVIRGGSWLNYLYYCRSSSRWNTQFGISSRDVGFRVKMSVPK